MHVHVHILNFNSLKTPLIIANLLPSSLGDTSNFIRRWTWFEVGILGITLTTKQSLFVVEKNKDFGHFLITLIRIIKVIFLFWNQMDLSFHAILQSGIGKMMPYFFVKNHYVNPHKCFCSIGPKRIIFEYLKGHNFNILRRLEKINL